MAGPKNTFLTEERQQQADDAYNLGWKKAQRKGDITNELKREIGRNKPEEGARVAMAGMSKYGNYGWSNDGGVGGDDLEDALIRAKTESAAQRQGKSSDTAVQEGNAAVWSAKAAKENRKLYGMKKGGAVSSASKRADGIAMRGKTRGKVY